MVLYSDFICSCYSHLTFLVFHCIVCCVGAAATATGVMAVVLCFTSFSFFSFFFCCGERERERGTEEWEREREEKKLFSAEVCKSVQQEKYLLRPASCYSCCFCCSFGCWFFFYYMFLGCIFWNLANFKATRTANETNENVNKMCDRLQISRLTLTHTHTLTHAVAYYDYILTRTTFSGCILQLLLYLKAIP